MVSHATLAPREGNVFDFNSPYLGIEDRMTRSPNYETCFSNVLNPPGHFQNLTLFDRSRNCGRLAYKKYSKNSTNPTAAWLPLFFDHIVTLEKEDIIDIQCVLKPLVDVTSWIQTNVDSSQWWSYFALIVDGNFSTRAGMEVFGVELSYPPNALETIETCTSDLQTAYDWKVELLNSINYTHCVRFSSPTLGIPLLPEFSQIDSVDVQEGDIFQVDKDNLQATILEATIESPLKRGWLVKLDEEFYNSRFFSDKFAVDMKLFVNPEMVPQDAQSVSVKLGVKFRKGPLFEVFSLQLPVSQQMPEPNSGSYDSVVVWAMVLFILIVLLSAMAYVYREEVTQSFYYPRKERSHVEIEMQGS